VNNKKVSLGLLFALVLLLVPALSACGYESATGDGVKHISHDIDMRFENCFVCHTGGNVPAGGEALGEVHKTYPMALCTSPACHPSEEVPVKPTTTKPTEPTEPEEPTTTEPTEPTKPSEPAGEPTAENAPAITNHPVGPGYDGLCPICHMLGGTDPIPDDGYHEDFDVDECYDCHKEG
jgi:outer membrane biosynthesis protein TonB